MPERHYAPPSQSTQRAVDERRKVEGLIERDKNREHRRADEMDELFAENRG